MKLGFLAFQRGKDKGVLAIFQIFWPKKCKFSPIHPIFICILCPLAEKKSCFRTVTAQKQDWICKQFFLVSD